MPLCDFLHRVAEFGALLRPISDQVMNTTRTKAAIFRLCILDVRVCSQMLWERELGCSIQL